jgi:NADH:ubiquinone oxidoreductase subunit 6 (subunit J)
VLEVIVFFVAAVLALGGAVGIVALRNPFFSVLALVGHLVALATLFLLLHSAFLAAAQVVVYAGAVMVLYVFVVAYIGGGATSETPPIDAVARLGPLFALALFVELTLALAGSGLTALDTEGPAVSPGFGSPEQVGALLLSRFLVAFEGASLLLLVAAVGAVVLARRRRGLDYPGGTPPGNPPEQDAVSVARSG